MTFYVELYMQDRWCRVGLDHTERAKAQALANRLAGDRDPVRIVLHEPGAKQGETIWVSDAKHVLNKAKREA